MVELALNLHWSWNHAADELWEALDKDLWATTQNPWVILRTVSREKIKAALGDVEFRNRLDTLLQKNRESYRADAWFQHKHPNAALTTVAYFSMEFMLSGSPGGNIPGRRASRPRQPEPPDRWPPSSGCRLRCQVRLNAWKQEVKSKGAQSNAYPAFRPRPESLARVDLQSVWRMP